MKMLFDTTVVAPATGYGGAISIIRISGKDSFAIVEQIFRRGSAAEESREKSVKKRSLESVPGYSIVYGDIIDGESIIDDVLVSVFRSPNSYTGEDSIEISCHASPFIRQKILEMLIIAGASPARPGEFTQRAYLNGKMDLSQAEAVADVIASETESSHRLAINQMRGGYSAEIKALREKMLHFASMLELELDFGEEDVEFADREQLFEMVTATKRLMDSLADSFRYGNAIKNGVPVAIVGKPNVGKSTLLNALLKDDKAIVSAIPGTTRDVIEDTIVIDGILFRFIDTAGLRETADVIENLGIRKTYQKIEQAEVVLLLTDASDGSDTILKAVSEIQKQIEGTGKSLMVVTNKTDLADPDKLVRLAEELDNSGNRTIRISASTGAGVSSLIDALIEIVNSSRSESQQLVVTNLRHYEALRQCSGSMERVLEGIKSGIAEDFIAMDLRQAIHYLGEITGDISNDEILGNIFKNFCIGK